MGDFRWSYNQDPAQAASIAIFHGIKDAEGTTHRLLIAEPANGATSFGQFISAEGASGYRWFQQSADTVYDYGSNSVEQFDKVFPTELAPRPIRSLILSRLTSMPRITKTSKIQELRENATMRPSSALACGINFAPATKSGGRLASPACLTVGRTGSRYSANRRSSAPNTPGHFSIPLSETAPGRVTAERS